MSDWIKPTCAVALPFVGAFFGSKLTSGATKTWYKTLKKPCWTPPNWAFPPVWTALYSSMGYASYLVWRDGGGFQGEAAAPLALYGTQLALNWAWTPLFFGARKYGLAMLEITALCGTAGACIFAFSPINKTASQLMMPYVAWLSLAASINAYVWYNNRDLKTQEAEEVKEKEEKKEEKKD